MAQQADRIEHEPIGKDLDHQHIKEAKDPQAHTFMLVAGTIMVAAVLFGLLNVLQVIKV